MKSLRKLQRSLFLFSVILFPCEVFSATPPNFCAELSWSEYPSADQIVELLEGRDSVLQALSCIEQELGFGVDDPRGYFDAARSIILSLLDSEELEVRLAAAKVISMRETLPRRSRGDIQKVLLHIAMEGLQRDREDQRPFDILAHSELLEQQEDLLPVFLQLSKDTDKFLAAKSMRHLLRIKWSSRAPTVFPEIVVLLRELPQTIQERAEVWLSVSWDLNTEFLLRMLTSRNSEVRRLLIRSLVALHPTFELKRKLAPAIPELKRVAATDPDPDLRVLARNALRKIDSIHAREP